MAGLLQRVSIEVAHRIACMRKESLALHMRGCVETRIVGVIANNLDFPRNRSLTVKQVANAADTTEQNVRKVCRRLNITIVDNKVVPRAEKPTGSDSKPTGF